MKNKWSNKSVKKNNAKKKELKLNKDLEKELKKEAKRERRKANAKKWYAFSGVLAVLACLLAAALFIQSKYTVTTAYVEGNLHYTNEEIMDIVMGGRLGSNSLYLSLKYKNKSIKGVPFVESMDVAILSPDTIRISVYEKALAGYVEYLGKFLYFDKDGIIVESSEVRTEGIPQVTGLDFNHVVLYERLPVDNEEVFMKILDTTQLLTKYGITADKIYFDKSYEMTLYFDQVKVRIGSSEGIDEKIMQLRHILPDLEGKKGTIRMENYTESKKTITFELE